MLLIFSRLFQSVYVSFVMNYNKSKKSSINEQLNALNIKKGELLAHPSLIQTFSARKRITPNFFLLLHEHL